MKLSEAIRLGALLGPQVRNGLFGSAGASCAIGSALLASGYDLNGESFPYDEASLKFPILGLNVAYPVLDRAYPVTGGSDPLICVIEVLNDKEGWTREQIADWVETIERQQDATPEPVNSAVSV